MLWSYGGLEMMERYDNSPFYLLWKQIQFVRYAWVILGAMFLSNVITAGYVKSFGLIYNAVAEVYPDSNGTMGGTMIGLLAGCRSCLGEWISSYRKTLNCILYTWVIKLNSILYTWVIKLSCILYTWVIKLNCILYTWVIKLNCILYTWVIKLNRNLRVLFELIETHTRNDYQYF